MARQDSHVGLVDPTSPGQSFQRNAIYSPRVLKSQLGVSPRESHHGTDPHLEVGA